MGRYRLSDPARADIAAILGFSEARHGVAARSRYRGLLTASLRRIATDPACPTSMDRGELLDGLRSVHIRHSRDESREVRVAEPVHVIFYRVREAGFIEIVRVLHERMEPSRHLVMGRDS
jgi:toxin ParE1/3/4